MADWSSSQYLKFKKQRTQPAVDLAMRVVEKRPETVVDIGCGPGNSTAVLRRISRMPSCSASTVRRI